MDIGKAFTFPFQTTRWAEKLLIPALITLIPIFGQIFLVGWYLDITRRVIHGEPDPLPELDFGRQLVDGLKGVVIALVYSLPLLVMVVLVGVFSEVSNNTSVEAGQLIFALFIMLFVALMFIYGLAMAFVLPAAMGHFVAKEDISAAFRFSEVLGLIRSAPGDYAIVLLIALLASAIAPLGAVVCGIGVAATTLYAMAVNGYMYGAAYNRARVHVI